MHREQDLKRSRLIIVCLVGFLAIILLFKFKAGLEYSSIEDEIAIEESDPEKIQLLKDIDALTAINTQIHLDIEGVIDELKRVSKDINPAAENAGEANRKHVEAVTDKINNLLKKYY